MDEKSSKPKFDKKKWREKKYDHKSQVKQKNETKKIILKSKLHRQLRRDQAANVGRQGQSFPSQPLFQEGSVGDPRKNNQRPPRLSRVQQAKLEFKRKQDEKRRLKEEKQKKREEIAKALAAYKEKKLKKFRLLSNKTKTGQPVMKGRMQLLFEQVKKSVGVNDELN